MWHTLILLVLASLAFGQTIELKDRNGIPVMTVNEIRMFRYSSYFKKDIADFQCSVKNISGKGLEDVTLRAVVHKKDGVKVEFTFRVGYVRNDSTVEAAHVFFQGPYTSDDFESVEILLPDWWQSPEDWRLAAEAQAQKEAAEALRRKRLAAEQKKKEAELEAKAAEEQRKIRAACTVIYRNTADKKVKDLTVQEEPSPGVSGVEPVSAAIKLGRPQA